MTKTPQSWDAYLRLQQKLLKCDRIDSHSWGLEEGLNSVLASDDFLETIDQEELEKTISNASRRERHRRTLRQTQRLLIEDEPTDPMQAIEALALLTAIKKLLATDDWLLMWNVGLGRNYAYAATSFGAGTNTLRARVLRIRRQLKKRFT